VEIERPGLSRLKRFGESTQPMQDRARENIRSFNIGSSVLRRRAPIFATSHSGRSSVAKLYATEGAQKVVDDALQLFGAAGTVRGSVPEQLYRQIRSLRIYEGTSEIQKLIIAGVLATA
jgi:alkylation response protein AidB-like acyl-CoA dehydrogenase